MPRTLVRDIKSTLLFPRGGTTGSVIVKSGTILAGLTNFSILAYGRFNLGAGNSSVVYCERANAGNDILKLQANLAAGSGKLLFTYRDDAGTLFQLNSTAVVKDSLFHHVGVTKQGTTVNLYVDGVPSGTSTMATTDNLTNAGISSRIGSDIAASSETMDGWLSKVGVYTSTLTPAQVMDAASTGTYPAGSAGLWELNEGAGSSAADSSGAGNGGTITSAGYSTEVPSRIRTTLSGNLVKNGDFGYAPQSNAPQTSNAWINGAAAGTNANPPIFSWRKFSANSSQTAMFDNSQSHSGQYSLNLTNAGGADIYNWLGTDRNVATAGPTAATLAENDIPVLPSTSYTFSFWAKANFTPAVNQVKAQLQYVKADTTLTGNTNIPMDGLTSSWQQFSATLTTAASDAYAILTFKNGVIGVTAAAGTVWIDDVYLQKTTLPARSATTSRSAASNRQLVS